MERRALEAPVFFPSASRVKIPFVGDDTRHIKVEKPDVNPVPNPLGKHQTNINKFFIKDVSKHLEFSGDVVKERCAHALPYDEIDFHTVYNANDVVEILPKSTKPTGRFNARGYIRKVPGHLTKLALPNAARMKQKPRDVTERHGYTAPRSARSEKSMKTVFLTETNAAFTEQIKKKKSSRSRLPSSYYISDNGTNQRKSKHGTPSEWDEYVLGRLSKDTARWIVFENVSAGSQKERLDRLVKNKFGAKISNTHLVREEGEETDIEAIENKKLELKNKELEERRHRKKIEKLEKLHADPLLQQTFAQYYKLPRFIKQERSKVITVSDSVNQTAQNLQVKHLEAPPPPKMQDFLNPAAGKFINSTQNAFEQQLYTNQAKPVYQKNGNKSRIIMDDLSEYQSNIQDLYPPNRAQWRHVNGKKKTHRSGNTTRGLQRWRGLPQPADFTSERGLNPPCMESAKFEDFRMSSTTTTMLNNAPMIHIVEEWRSKWRLASRWQDITLADVITDMNNIHDHLRLGAVAACAMASLHKIPVADLAVLPVLPTIDASVCDGGSEKGHLPEVLLTAVRKNLEDSNSRVRLAAAMCLYTLSICDETVEEILEHNLEHGVPTDKMACAQCLALSGNTDARVVHLLIQMLLETDQQSQATALLVHVSQHTRLVHSLLAEQLNSSSWKDKVISCKVLAQLSGNINRDLVHKLSNLMWEDWSSEVRKAASRTLGRTGHGRDVHFDLREKLATGNERVCADVLRKIAHLGIMTATLLPEFIKCFSAEYVSVRLESCKTAAKLMIADERVVKQLVRLTQFDPAWKIKAYAIKALGDIGMLCDKAESSLVWALRFEDEPGVRLEACVAICKLNCQSDEVIHVLQDRVLVEPDAAVKEEVRKTLDAFGMSGPEDNMEMIRQIKAEVQRLCKKSVVAAKVIMYEKELDKYERKAQYIGNVLYDSSSSNDSSDDDDVTPEINNVLMKSRASSSSRKNSLPRPPSITLTPSADRPETREKSSSRIEVLYEEDPSMLNKRDSLTPIASTQLTP